MGHLLDVLARGFDAWRLGALALLLAAVGTAAIVILLAIPLALLAVLIEAMIGAPVQLVRGFDGGTWLTLVVIFAAPIGIGVSIPYLRPAAAQFEAAGAERQKRAAVRLAERYRS